MTVLRLDHVGVVVDDFGAAIEFFAAVGLELDGEMSVEGDSVGRIIGLEGARSDLAIMQTPDGFGKIELVKFHAPAYEGESTPEPSHAPGIRHVLFAVDDVDATVNRLNGLGYELVGSLENYENIYRLCYVRGPADIIVELAERIA
ncbi:MAG: VOC family protein [Solirubrobacterales bacterium]